MTIQWLAGLLEGEGCFTSARVGSVGRHTTPLVSLCMTDKDVIEQAVTMMERIGKREFCRHTRRLPSGKRAYQVQTTGLPAAKIMVYVLPLMGHRRRRRIRHVLAQWKPRKYKEAIAFKLTLD